MATRRRRTRSADSTRNMSLTSSNVTVISGAIGSPRSSLRACSRARRKNPPAPSAVTHTLAFLFIFAPPQVFYFVLELLNQRFIIRKLYRSGPAHIMAVMLVVAVIVAEHTAIIGWANPRVNVGQAVLDYFVACKPSFFLKNRAPSHASEIEGLIYLLIQLGRLLASPRTHRFSISQVG